MEEEGEEEFLDWREGEKRREKFREWSEGRETMREVG